MKQLSHLTLLSNKFIHTSFTSLFTALCIAFLIPLLVTFSGQLYAAAEYRAKHPEQDLLADINRTGPHHGFTTFPIRNGDNEMDELDFLGQGALDHDKSLVEKGWDWYYSLNPIATKAAPTTRGMGTVWHYGQQLLAIGKRKAQKFGPNSDEVAALKLGINIEWPNSTLHDQDRNRYVQEALHSRSQIQQEYENRQTTPITHYVSERIADLTYFLAFTVDKSKPYYQRKKILESIKKIHADSNLLDFDIPKLNMTGAKLIPLYDATLSEEETAAGKKPAATAQAKHNGDGEDDLGISSASDEEESGKRKGSPHKLDHPNAAELAPEEKRQ